MRHEWLDRLDRRRQRGTEAEVDIRNASAGGAVHSHPRTKVTPDAEHSVRLRIPRPIKWMRMECFKLCSVQRVLDAEERHEVGLGDSVRISIKWLSAGVSHK